MRGPAVREGEVSLTGRTIKPVEVVAGVIFRGGRVLVARRARGELSGKWEFPGGKVEPGEEPRASLRRELQEELSINVSVGPMVCTYRFDYPGFPIVLNVFLCTRWEGAPKAGDDHSELVWVSPRELEAVDLADADRKAAERVMQLFVERKLLV